MTRACVTLLVFNLLSGPISLAVGQESTSDDLRKLDHEIVEGLLSSMPYLQPEQADLIRKFPDLPPDAPPRREIPRQFSAHIPQILQSGDSRPQAFAALLSIRLGLADSADALANAAVHNDPRFPTAFSVRSYIRGLQGNLPGAAEDAHAALQLDPNDAAARTILSWSEGQIKLPAPWESGAPRPASPPPGRPPSPGGPPPALVIALIVIALLTISILLAMTIFRGFGLAWTRITKGPVPPAVPTPPSSLSGQYELLRTIGRGGMGVVYEARDQALERSVAVKKMRDEIRDDPQARERFVREAKLVAKLHHPAIVEIYAIVADGADLAIIFEYVDGKTVDALLAEAGRLTLESTRRILRPVCAALDFAHGQDVIHRDLKPSNIMVTAHATVKVMDFGIARQAKDALSKFSMTNAVMGTPLYMPPEAELGVVCRESDIYALGAMAYEMTTGRHPFPAPATAEQKRARNYAKASTLVPGLPVAFDALIDAALEPEPSRRIHSAGEFRARLDGCP